MKWINYLKIQARIFMSQAIFKLTIGVVLAFTLFFAFIIHNFSTHPFFNGFFSLMKGYKNGFNFSSSLTYLIFSIIIFFIIIISSTAISNEIQRGTIKIVLVQRFKRNKLILSKSLFLLIFFFILFTVVFLLSFAIGGSLYGLGDIAEKKYIIHSGISLIINYFIALLLMVFPIFALINFSIFFSVLFNNSIIAIISNLGINFLFYILVQLEVFKNILLVNYLFLPMEIFKKMSQGLPILWSPDIWYMIMVTTIYSFVFLFLSIRLFNKKEIL